MKEIAVSRGYVAMVDDEDFDRVSMYRWYPVTKGRVVYARTYLRKKEKNGGKRISMHALLLPVSEGFTVDHVDGNGLNNQRSNLRPATKAQQLQNCPKHNTARKLDSAYKGVTEIRGAWFARLRDRGKLYMEGPFREEYDAAQAYNFMAEEHFGEFARMNTPL